MPCDTKPGSFIERKKIALTWHYRRADPEYGAFQASECHRHLNRTVTRKYDIEVMTGKANLEVRPKFVNKGEIVKQLVADYGEGSEDIPEFVLCFGDDFTDEGTPYHAAPIRPILCAFANSIGKCRYVPQLEAVEVTARSCLLSHRRG